MLTLQQYLETQSINEDWNEYPRPDTEDEWDVWLGDCWLFEMANVSKRKSGLPVNIMFSSIGDDLQHGPRIKFQRDNADKVNYKALVPMMISLDPQMPSMAKNKAENKKISADILNTVRRWILGNRILLLLSWEQLLDEGDVHNSLRPLSEITDDIIARENQFNYTEFKKMSSAEKQKFAAEFMETLHSRQPENAPSTLDELMDLVYGEIEKNGKGCSLNHINTSKIQSMAGLFDGIEFEGDISEWDVSNVKSMTSMFKDCSFDGDLSKWNVSNVKTADMMFMNSKFTGDISVWTLTSLRSSYGMFEGCGISEKHKPKIN